MIKIVTDSTCDLPTELVDRYNITVVPIHIYFGTDHFLDRVTIDAVTFYDRIASTGEIPTTSQPSVGEFAAVYRQLAAEGADTVVSMHVTGQLSGTVRSAELAAKEVADEVDVRVFDSLAGSAALGYMAMEAAQAAQAGFDVEAILSMLKRIRDGLSIVLTPLNLEFLQKSGRVSKLQGAIGALLNIKPIIELRSGTLEATERVRSRRKAIERLLVRTLEQHGTDRALNLAVVHANAPEDGRRLLDRVVATFPVNRVLVTELALSVAVHLGPGTVGVVAYPAELGFPLPRLEETRHRSGTTWRTNC